MSAWGHSATRNGSRLLWCSACLWFGVGQAGVVAETAVTAAATAVPTPREAALETLLAERRSPEAHQVALEAARRHGVSPQAMLEARFLFHVERRDEAAIVALLPELTAASDGFRLEESAICSVREDWLAILEYARALAALRSGDEAGFKAHITEAFWFSPGQAAAYAAHIEQYQNRQLMQRMRVDLQQGYQPMDGSPVKSLASVLEGKRGLVLHFWSPWSGENADFIRMAEQLHERGLAVLSLVSDSPSHMAAEARDSLPSQPMPAKTGGWGIDLGAGKIARGLRIRSLPCIVWVRPDGSIGYHGPPDGEALIGLIKQAATPAAAEPPASGR